MHFKKSSKYKIKNFLSFLWGGKIFGHNLQLKKSDNILIENYKMSFDIITVANFKCFKN